MALGVLLHQQDLDPLEVVAAVDQLIQLTAGLTGGSTDLAAGGLTGDQHLVAALADHFFEECEEQGLDGAAATSPAKWLVATSFRPRCAQMCTCQSAR